MITHAQKSIHQDRKANRESGFGDALMEILKQDELLFDNQI